MTVKNKERDNFVLNSWKKHVPQVEVAKVLGVTRQRVQQIERRLGLGSRREQIEIKRYESTCGVCKKQVFAKAKQRKFCSRACYYVSKQRLLTDKEREEKLQQKRLRDRNRSKKYYHEVFKKKPNWRALVKDRNSHTKGGQ